MENIKEFRVRPVTRYIVTYYEAGATGVCSGVVAEFDNEYMANKVWESLEEARPGMMPATAAPLSADGWLKTPA